MKYKDEKWCFWWFSGCAMWWLQDKKSSFEVLVIGHHKNYTGCAFQIRLPVLERFMYCEKFFVVYLVVEFCGNHGSQVEGDGV